MNTSVKKVKRLDQGGQKSPREYGILLDNIAANLLAVIPSEIKNEDILELERLLNDLYIQAYQQSWAFDLQEAILEALSWAGELGDTIKRRSSGKSRPRRFFRTVKRFINLFQVMAVYLNEEDFSTNSIVE